MKTIISVIYYMKHEYLQDAKTSYFTGNITIFQQSIAYLQHQIEYMIFRQFDSLVSTNTFFAQMFVTIKTKVGSCYSFFATIAKEDCFQQMIFRQFHSLVSIDTDFT